MIMASDNGLILLAITLAPVVTFFTVAWLFMAAKPLLKQ